MCLGVPGRLIEMSDASGLPSGVVDFGGARRTACLAYVPGVEVGQYVIVHVGFAISIVDEEEAFRTYALLEEMDLLEELDAAADVAADDAANAAVGVATADGAEARR